MSRSAVILSIMSFTCSGLSEPWAATSQVPPQKKLWGLGQEAQSWAAAVSVTLGLMHTSRPQAGRKKQKTLESGPMSLFHSSIHWPGTLWLIPLRVSSKERSTHRIILGSTTTVLSFLTQGEETLLEYTR